MASKHELRCKVCNHTLRPSIEEFLTKVPGQMSLQDVADKFGVGYKTLQKHLEYLKNVPVEVSTPKEAIQEVITAKTPEEFLQKMLAVEPGKITGNALISAARALADIQKNKPTGSEIEEYVLKALRSFESFTEEAIDGYIKRVESVIATIESGKSTETK